MIASKAKNTILFLLTLILQSIILFKSTILMTIGYFLTLVSSFDQLLYLTNFKIFTYEYLYKIALRFSDFNFRLSELFYSTSLFDILPILIIILLLDINRVIFSSKHLLKVLLLYFLIYFIKYFVLILIVIKDLLFQRNIVLSFNIIGYFLIVVGILFIINIIYNILVVNKVLKNDY